MSLHFWLVELGMFVSGAYLLTNPTADIDSLNLALAAALFLGVKEEKELFCLEKSFLVVSLFF